MVLRLAERSFDGNIHLKCRNKQKMSLGVIRHVINKRRNVMVTTSLGLIDDSNNISEKYFINIVPTLAYKIGPSLKYLTYFWKGPQNCSIYLNPND
jgi:hypothetical protein